MSLNPFLAAILALIYPCFSSAYTGDDFVRDKQLYFTENAGQVRDQNGNAREDIDFKLSTESGISVFVGDGVLHWQFYKDNLELRKDDTHFCPPPVYKGKGSSQTDTADPLHEGQLIIYRMDVELVGANKDAEIIVSSKSPVYDNYYIPGAPEGGAVAYTYGRIVYQGVYPGIDWVLTTTDGALKHEFIIHPGGSAADIRLKYSGAEELVLNADGSLTATTAYGNITEAAPFCYDESGAAIAGKYLLKDSVLSYEVASYDGMLVIDPELTWSTYYGGDILENCRDIYIDDSDHNYLYVTGFTLSANNIATIGAHQVTLNGSVVETGYDAFLAKFTITGSRVWSTYFGGEKSDRGYGVTTDSTGMVYICGTSGSRTGIGTPGTYKDTLTESTPSSISQDVFVAKFTNSGSLAWGTYLGGEHSLDIANCITTDTAGAVYIGGLTGSTMGIGTTGAHQPSNASSIDAYIMKLSTNGQLQWGTYIGGERNENIYTIAADRYGNIYAGGYSLSDTGIATAGSHQALQSPGNTTAGMLIKFNTAGKRLWGSYYGHNNSTNVSGIAIDRYGNVYIGGQTYADTGIATAGTYRDTLKGSVDAYLARFDSSGARRWGTYYGGTGDEYVEGIALDRTGGRVFVCGRTESFTDIALNSGIQTALKGGRWDAFAAQFDTTGGIIWGTYYGGSSNDQAHSIAVDKQGSWYLAGSTESDTVLATNGAHQTQKHGNMDGFITRFCDSLAAITVQPADQKVTDGNKATFTVQVNGSYTYQWQVDDGTGFIDLANGGKYSGVTTNNLTINPVSLNQSGERYRCILHEGTCRETSADAALLITVGINDINSASIHLHPNPVEQAVTVSLTEGVRYLEVLNMQGQRIVAQHYNSRPTSVTLDISQLPAAIYIVKVNDTYVKRLVKL